MPDTFHDMLPTAVAPDGTVRFECVECDRVMLLHPSGSTGSPFEVLIRGDELVRHRGSTDQRLQVGEIRVTPPEMPDDAR